MHMCTTGTATATPAPAAAAARANKLRRLRYHNHNHKTSSYYVESHLNHCVERFKEGIGERRTRAYVMKFSERTDNLRPRLGRKYFVLGLSITRLVKVVTQRSSLSCSKDKE